MKHLKTSAILCVMAAALVLIMGFGVNSVYADTQEPVKYVDENGTENQVNDYIVLKGSETEIGAAEETWYVANDNITFEKNLKVKDNAKVNLILCKGKKMKCKDNFTVNESSELRIWGQEEKGGEIESTGGFFSGSACIGGETGHSNGLIEIHSGKVDAHLDGASFSFLHKGAAIGAGNGANGGTIRLLGGHVIGWTAGSGTGIGGGHGGHSGNILISGGDVHGGSKQYGAGIGAGDEAGDNNTGNIVISGGNVYGSSHAGAGIGGGEHTEGGSITITGGTIEAYGNDGTLSDAGAGIGGGNEAKAGVINIKGGTITARSGAGGGAPIGCGEDCEADENGVTGEIYISGGKIDARAGDSSESAGIGGSNGANGCHVVITGGEVYARGNASFVSMYNTNGGAGIGGGDNGNGGIVEIYGGKVTAIAGGDAAGIGGGDHGSGGTTKIYGGEVGALGAICGAGIGGGETKTGGNISISGGTVVAIGGSHLSWSGAGIGGGDSASGSSEGETIHITGGNITATGGNEAAGIGGGDDGGAGNVVIDGGVVSANGGKYAAGIGTGQKPDDDRKNDGSLEINGGYVEARGGVDGAGIGGGENADGIKVTINGGTVVARGEDYGSGIGGGENGKGCDLTVNGGMVTAIAGADCKVSEADGGSAIGSGQGIEKPSDIESDIFGRLSLGESMMVITSDKGRNAAVSTVDKRKYNAAWNNNAQIMPCTHDGVTGIEKDENGHKIPACPYCGLDQSEKEAHKYVEGKCSICGWDQPRDKTVSFNAGEHGEGTMEAYMAYSGEKYPLPKCGFEAESGYVFSGWRVGGDLKSKGESIEITEDLTVTAEWKDVGTNVWNDLQTKFDQGGQYTLESDILAPKKSSVLGIEHGNTVSLDMKGYAIDRNHLGGAVLAVGGYGTGNLSVENGQLMGGSSGIALSEGSSLTVRDITITGNNYYGINMSMDENLGGGGYLSIAGKIRLDGNEEGGILLAKGRRINIADTLSKDSVIPVRLPETPSEGDGVTVIPTVDDPIVITSGLKGKGDVKCFTTDNNDYMVGENADGEAVIGIPTKVSFAAGDGSTDEEHSMSGADAVCSAVYTLPECGFMEPENSVFQGWKKEGSEEILPAGEKVPVTENMTFTACYTRAPQPVTVNLNVGPQHNRIAAEIADTFNAGKEGDDAIATASGTTVSIQMPEDMTITDVENKICTIMHKANISYDGKDGNKWTETVGLKRLSEYPSFEQHEKEELQNTPGHGGDPIREKSTAGEDGERVIDFHVHWLEPVTSVELTIDEPVCGTEVTVDDNGKPDKTPEVKKVGAEPPAGIAKPESTWKSSDGKRLFRGTITGGETYCASTYIAPAHEYYIPENVAVKVNGADADAQDITFTNGVLMLQADMVAAHDCGEDPVPQWTWNGYESASAAFTCAADPSHITTITDDEIYKEEKQQATHSREGISNYTAAVEFGGGTYTNTITQVAPKTDHEWGEAEYTWYEDNSRVLAKRSCTLDPSHVETEVAETSSEVTTPATCEAAGETTYTASFENEAFSTQTKVEDNIPALGHEWNEWMVTKEPTEEEAGEETRTCTHEGCGETETRAILPKDHEHGLSHKTAQAASCTEDGWEEYYVCDQGEFKCGRYFADAEGEQEIDYPRIPATGHDYQTDWNWSDDHSSATLTYVCRNDESDKGTVKADVTVEETAPVCESAGSKLYVATAADGPDGKTYTDVYEEEIPAVGHNYGGWKNFDADTHQRVCANDANHVELQNHDWDEGEVTVPPSMTSEGIRTYTCETCHAEKKETIPRITPDTPIPFTGDMVSLSAESFEYNGSVQKPEVEVRYAGELVGPDNYSVTYSDENSTDAGTYTVSVRMGSDRGFSTDPVEKTYTIVQAQPAPAPAPSDTTQVQASEILDLPAVKITKPKAAKKKMTVKWKKVSKKNLKKISGIQIQVATDPGFTNIVKTANVGKKKKSKKIGGLQPKTKYYVRIRAYGAPNHFSVWKAKSVKVK